VREDVNQLHGHIFLLKANTIVVVRGFKGIREG